MDKEGYMVLYIMGDLWWLFKSAETILSITWLINCLTVTSKSKWHIITLLNCTTETWRKGNVHVPNKDLKWFNVATGILFTLPLVKREYSWFVLSLWREVLAGCLSTLCLVTTATFEGWQPHWDSWKLNHVLTLLQKCQTPAVLHCC